MIPMQLQTMGRGLTYESHESIARNRFWLHADLPFANQPGHTIDQGNKIRLALGVQGWARISSSRAPGVGHLTIKFEQRNSFRFPQAASKGCRGKFKQFAPARSQTATEEGREVQDPRGSVTVNTKTQRANWNQWTMR